MLLLTFTAGPNQYAVDVMRVVELVPKVVLRKIPHAPAFLAGLLGYRGKVVPVIDLGLLLEGRPCRDHLSSRIILVNDSGAEHNRWNQNQDDSYEETKERRTNRQPASTLLGLVAEHVCDLIYAQPEQIIPAPISLPQIPYLGAIVQTDQGIVQLIVVEKVREASLQSSDTSQTAALDSTSDPSSMSL
jgi:chemotaxis-related protein WspB